MSESAGAPGEFAFPTRRPEIVVQELDGELGGGPSDVDCKELRGHFIVPEVGEHARWAMYEAPRWELTGISEFRAVRRALVHEVKGVEIEVTDRDREGGWKPERWTMYGRLTDDTAEWLAVITMTGKERRVYTFLDDGFEDDWGRMRRKLADTGDLVLGADGSYTRRPGASDDIGAGVFDVRVGDGSSRCLRVIDIQGDPDDEHGILQEQFITRSGRTVLSRRYNATRWDRRPGKRPHYGSAPTWEEELPDAARLVVDGITFVHWYDSLSGPACGLVW